MKKFAKSKIIIAIIVCIVLLGGSFFVGGLVGLKYFQDEYTAATKVDEPKEEDLTKIVNINVNGQDVAVDLNAGSHTWYDANQMTTEMPNKIDVGTVEGYDIFVEGAKASAGKTAFSINLDKLSHARGIELKFVNSQTNEEKYFYIRTLTSVYTGDTYGQGTGDGVYYFNDGAGFMYKMDMQGNIIFYKKAVSTTCFDFKRIEVNGNVYYTYLEDGVDNTNEKLSVPYMRTRAVVMDKNYEVIDYVEFLSTEKGMPEKHSLENHDFVMLDKGHYLLSSYVGTNVENIPADVDEDGDGKAYVAAAVIQEIKDGKLLFQWNSTEHPELYALSSFNNDFTNKTMECADYIHFNSITVDERDNNFVCSFRNIDTILKLDRQTGEIIWKLGGIGDEFGLTEDQKFSHQHFAKFSDEQTITFFDNGNANKQTRVIEIAVDEANHKLISYNAYQIDGKFSPAKGSAQRLSETENLFLVGWGSLSPDDIIFSEINFDTNEKVFEMLRGGEKNSAYRVYKFAE